MGNYEGILLDIKDILSKKGQQLKCISEILEEDISANDVNIIEGMSSQRFDFDIKL